MTLQESEARLSELNAEINKLLKEREAVLKEWNTAFNMESPENIGCEVENIEDICYKLYLVNEGSRMYMCTLDNYDSKGSVEEFYEHIDNSLIINRIASGRDNDIPEYQKNLVYAKAIEIRERYLNNQRDQIQRK